jgi:hypothetical protein
VNQLVKQVPLARQYAANTLGLELGIRGLHSKEL